MRSGGRPLTLAEVLVVQRDVVSTGVGSSFSRYPVVRVILPV